MERTRDNSESQSVMAIYNLVAYPPVQFDRSDHRQNLRTSTRYNRAKLLKALHESIEATLSPLADVARACFVVKFSNEQKVRLQNVLCSYVTDFSEAEDMKSVIRGVLTSFPCHRYLVKKANFKKFRVNISVAGMILHLCFHKCIPQMSTTLIWLRMFHRNLYCQYLRYFRNFHLSLLRLCWAITIFLKLKLCIRTC